VCADWSRTERIAKSILQIPGHGFVKLAQDIHDEENNVDKHTSLVDAERTSDSTFGICFSLRLTDFTRKIYKPPGEMSKPVS
jgi:hypothetical protein